MKLFKYILSAICGMAFMAFIGYAGGSEWGTDSFGWLLFCGAVISVIAQFFSDNSNFRG